MGREDGREDRIQEIVLRDVGARAVDHGADRGAVDDDGHVHCHPQRARVVWVVVDRTADFVAEGLHFGVDGARGEPHAQFRHRADDAAARARRPTT